MSPPSSLPPPVLVEDGETFDSLLGDLERERVVAVDTEADSFFHYREKVCLIQITAGRRDYVVDPLAGFDVSPLGELFADERRTKVFHDGEYDVLILKRDYGFRFASLFDTRVASAALGEKNPGLASVLKKHFGVELDKSLQRSDWSRRPLGPEQIAYARLDTHFLVPLMDQLAQELERRDRTAIVAGECERIAVLEPPERAFNPDEYARIKGARALDGAGLSILRELFVLRDRVASEVDRPPFKVMSNQLLLTLAQEAPRNARALSRLPGFSARMVRRLGDDVLDAIAHARERGPVGSLPQLPSKDGTGGLDEIAYELHERLRIWRKARAEAEDIDASLVLNRHVLVELARTRPRDERGLQRAGLIAWQLERLGKELLRLVADFERDLAAGRVETPKGRRSRREG